MSTSPAAGAAPAVRSSPSSGKSRSRSPQDTAPVQAELVPADDQDDNDSLGDNESEIESTASVTSSILEYRTIEGRTFHSDRHDTEYFTPNDNQQSQSIDITHHFLVLLLGGKLHITPLGPNVQKVLDVGTGNGIWAIDFADENPQAEVIGTDLSPTQPSWVPPNLKFEIDDCTKEWTFEPNTFDFIHLRFLFGAIRDWTALFQQAYRACRPGGWVQSSEAEVIMLSDDGTVTEDSTMQTLWNPLFKQAGEKLGNSFLVVSENSQKKGLEEAGFTEIKEVTYKVPMNSWPKDPELAEVGRFVLLTMDNDIEGYTMYLWNHVMGWSKEGYQVFLATMRKEMRSRKIHSYFYVRYVYGRKPETATEG